MNSKLMLITVSKVQEFISNSRKTMDFYNSSHGIIDFMQEIIGALKLKNDDISNFQILLPSLEKIESPETSMDIPNYFIAKIQSNIENKELEESLREHLKNNVNEQFNYIDLDVYIVIVDYAENNYNETYFNLYKKLNAYKNNRFKDRSLIKKQVSSDKNALNCVICGVRKGKYISSKCNLKKIKDNSDSYTTGNNLIDEKEVLCESCFKKRQMQKQQQNYSSVVDISAIEWEDKLTNSDKSEALKDYDEYVKNLIKKFHIEACEANFYHEDFIYSCEKIEESTKKQLLKDLKKLTENYKPSRYYALIKADIDNLGKHFSGKYLFEEDNLLNHQQTLSNNILNFASKIKDKLDKNLSIYIGGDDILFFCPLYKIFESIELINSELKNIKLNGNKNLTISISIVIAHSSTPLKQVISLSRSSLDNAKDKFKKDNKNALALSLINSSCTIRTAYLKNNINNITTVKNLINGFKKHISKSFIQQLERVLYLLGESMTYEEYEVLMNVIINQIKKISDRKIQKNSDEYNIFFKNLLYEFVHIKSNDYFVDFTGYFNLLHITEKFSRETIDDLKMEEENE